MEHPYRLEYVLHLIGMEVIKVSRARGVKSELSIIDIIYQEHSYSFSSDSSL